MPKIYSFSTKSSDSTFTSSPQNIGSHQDGNLIRGNLTHFNLPIVFKHIGGKKIFDILPTGYPCLYLISDNLKNLLESNLITGWKSYPIVLLDKNGQEIHGYHGLSIIGTCDPEDYSQSEIIEMRYVQNGPIVKKYKGYKVTPCGNFDFFIPPQTIGFYISEKLALLLKKKKITNIRLEDIDEEEVRCKTVNPNFVG
jgi:hypothetical protein